MRTLGQQLRTETERLGAASGPTNTRETVAAQDTSRLVPVRRMEGSARGASGDTGRDGFGGGATGAGDIPRHVEEEGEGRSINTGGDARIKARKPDDYDGDRTKLDVFL